MAERKMPDSYNSTPIVAPTGIMRRRMFFIVLALLLVLAGYITTVLYNTAVVKSEYYRSKANSQQLKKYTITANRGTIYDRNNKILAQSTTVWDIVISPKSIEENDSEKKELICKTLSELLDVDYEKIMNGCENTDNEYFIVKKKVGKADKELVQQFIDENDLAPFSVKPMENSKRYYPNNSLASSIIGFTNYDNEGVYGLEAYYNDYLKGVDGLIAMAKDANGDAMPYDYENRYEASDGNSLVLTIDEVVQHYLEKNLETAISQHKVANRATGIVMNAKTGAIIAMATAPGYDLNNPSELSEYDMQELEELRQQLILDYAAGSLTDQEEINKLIEEELEETEAEMRETQWKNKAVSELYFPGSVFKVITCASALEEEVVDLNSHFTCLAAYEVDGTKFHCWSAAGHGDVDLQSAITASCNPAFIQIGLKLGKKLFTSYFEAFGFTEKTGIDLPGEASPLYVPYERMGRVELASSSFGQTNKITPIQMICAYAAAVNGGYLVTPHVVDKIIDSSGNVIKTVDPAVKRQVISAETSELMRQITENIVTYNGGSNAYIAGYRIGGKSGTSEKLDQYGNNNMRYVGSFCAFTPANDPEYIMLVCVDEPLGGKYYGSMVAAPVVSAVFSECLEYLGVYPQYTADELADQDVQVPYVYDYSLLDAITSINTKGLKYEIVGDEDVGIVDYTIPAASERIPNNGTVIIYMRGAEQVPVTVPDLSGLTVEQANAKLTKLGLNISLDGGAVNNASAIASSQTIDPGTEVSKGTVVGVTFLVNEDTG
ncbi:MAG: penicillin-binding transpeptidase domain-containing protein [Ruminiclostridium sp.]